MNYIVNLLWNGNNKEDSKSIYVEKRMLNFNDVFLILVLLLLLYNSSTQ